MLFKTNFIQNGLKLHQSSGIFGFSKSYYQNVEQHSATGTFYHQDLTIQKDPNPQAPNSFETTIPFGHLNAPHMLQVDWTQQKGWGQPQIVPFAPLQLHPFSSSLHYAIQCFEGSKAFKTKEGNILSFRLDSNMYRMKQTCQALTLPDFDGIELEKCINELIQLDKDYVPSKDQTSLYIRPTAIATEETLGVRAPTKSKIFVVNSPVGPYFPQGFKPVQLHVEDKKIRAAPGGHGCYKMGSNYGPTILKTKEVEKLGYNQILWLWKNEVVELGASNIFFLWINEKGEMELITPPNSDLILPGVTRDSILDIARSLQRFKVSEKQIRFEKIVKAIRENRLIEAFVAGTAVTCGPIELFHYQNEDYKVPLNSQINSGELTQELVESIQNIQYGRVKHEKWSKLIC